LMEIIKLFFFYTELSSKHYCHPYTYYTPIKQICLNLSLFDSFACLTSNPKG